MGDYPHTYRASPNFCSSYPSITDLRYCNFPQDCRYELPTEVATDKGLKYEATKVYHYLSSSQQQVLFNTRMVQVGLILQL